MGFQRRFDAAYRRLRAAIASGELGFVHTIRAATHDQSPPPPGYLPSASGGLFRDAAIHDYDVIRFVTGREVAQVYAAGNKQGRGSSPRRETSTPQPRCSRSTTTPSLSASVTRYNTAGHDIRMEVHGSLGALAAGLDDRFPMTSAEPGARFPAGPAHQSSSNGSTRPIVRDDRVRPGRSRCAAGRCTVAGALEAFRVAGACGISAARAARWRWPRSPGRESSGVGLLIRPTPSESGAQPRLTLIC